MNEGIEELGRFMLDHNPFCVKNKKGRVLRFEKYVDIYLYVLKYIRCTCKRGYFDFPVLVQGLTQWTPEMCMELNDRVMKTYPLLREDCIIIDWTNLKAEEKVLITILKGLHEITMSDFDVHHYQVAWEQFVEFNKTYTDDQIEKILR